MDYVLCAGLGVTLYFLPFAPFYGLLCLPNPNIIFAIVIRTYAEVNQRRRRRRLQCVI